MPDSFPINVGEIYITISSGWCIFSHYPAARRRFVAVVSLPRPRWNGNRDLDFGSSLRERREYIAAINLYARISRVRPSNDEINGDLSEIPAAKVSLCTLYVSSWRRFFRNRVFAHAGEKHPRWDYFPQVVWNSSCTLAWILRAGCTLILT